MCKCKKEIKIENQKIKKNICMNECVEPEH